MGGLNKSTGEKETSSGGSSGFYNTEGSGRGGYQFASNPSPDVNGFIAPVQQDGGDGPGWLMELLFGARAEGVSGLFGGLGNLPSDPRYYGTGGGGGSGWPSGTFGVDQEGGGMNLLQPGGTAGGGGTTSNAGAGDSNEPNPLDKFGDGPPAAPPLDVDGGGFFGQNPQDLYNGFYDEAMGGFEDRLADPYDLWRQMIPEMEATRDRNISQAISESGLVGQRYSSSTQRRVGEIGMESALAEDALLASLIADRDNALFNYELQARSIANDQLGQMFQMAQYEQNRQDAFYNLKYQDWQNRSLGWLGLLLPGIMNIGAPQGQGTFDTGTGATPGLIDFAEAIAALFDLGT